MYLFEGRYQLDKGLHDYLQENVRSPLPPARITFLEVYSRFEGLIPTFLEVYFRFEGLVYMKTPSTSIDISTAILVVSSFDSPLKRQ